MRNQDRTAATAQTSLPVKVESLQASQGIPQQMLGAKQKPSGARFMNTDAAAGVSSHPPRPRAPVLTAVPRDTLVLDSNETTEHNVCCLQPRTTMWVQKPPLLPGHLFCIFDLNFSLHFFFSNKQHRLGRPWNWIGCT